MRIEFYEDATGKKLVTEFLDGLDIKMRQKMLRSVKALQEIGTALRMPLSEYLEDGIFELRAKVGSNITRKKMSPTSIGGGANIITGGSAYLPPR